MFTGEFLVSTATLAFTKIELEFLGSRYILKWEWFFAKIEGGKCDGRKKNSYTVV